MMETGYSSADHDQLVKLTTSLEHIALATERIEGKLDKQATVCECRAVTCNEAFLRAKVFWKMVMITVVVMGGMFTASLSNMGELNAQSKEILAVKHQIEMKYTPVQPNYGDSRLDIGAGF